MGKANDNMVGGKQVEGRISEEGGMAIGSHLFIWLLFFLGVIWLLFFLGVIWLLFFLGVCCAHIPGVLIGLGGGVLLVLVCSV
jgi:hypothetical protein